MPLMRRARGAVLRIVRRRALSIVLGLLLVGLAVWLEVWARVDAWWVEGTGLVTGAIGVALLWNAIAGTTPDWVE
jgi:hypothetical protein